MVETIRSSNGTGALNVINSATSGAGSALSVKSANTSTPLITGQGASTLLCLKDSSGNIKFTIGNTGAVTLTGALSGITTLSNTGDQTVTSGNMIIATAGKGLQIKEGSNATLGTGTLNGATEVTIATTAVTTTSRIFLSIETPGGTPSGQIFVSSRIAATSFGVKSVALDTSTFAWLIINPAP